MHVPVSKRVRVPRSEAPRLQVIPPPPVASSVESRADVAITVLRREGHATHRAFPFTLAGGRRGAVCALCGAGGVTVSK
eukprot:8740427-Pyramimonas_sp.AAC.1